MKNQEPSDEEYSKRAIAGLDALLERKHKARPELHTPEVYKMLSEVVKQSRSTRRRGEVKNK